MFDETFSASFQVEPEPATEPATEPAILSRLRDLHASGAFEPEPTGEWPITVPLSLANPAEATDTLPEQQSERFVIDSEEKAEWALRKGAAIDAEITLLKSQYRARLSELEADKASWERRFVEELKAWAETERQKRRRQTVTTLAGTLAFRAVPARWTVTDEDAVLQACYDALPDAIVRTVSIDKKMLFEHVEATGELLPGVERTEAGESFSVRFPKAGKGIGEEE